MTAYPRLLYPDAASVDRVQAVAGLPLLSSGNATVRVYVDEAGTELADILNADESANPTATLILDNESRIPEFYGPTSGVEKLWVRVDGGTPLAVYAQITARLEHLVTTVDDMLTVQDAEVAATLTAFQASERAFNADNYDAGIGTVIYVDPTGDDANSGLIPSRPMLTVAAALAALPAGAGEVRLTPGAVYPMGAGDSLTLDVSKVSIVGHESVLNWSAAPTAGFAVQLTSTGSYVNRYRQWRHVLDGVIIRGLLAAPNLAGIGLLMGDDSTTEISAFTLTNGGVEGFATTTQFGNNAWRIALEDFHIRNGSSNAIYCPTGRSNAGECMTFTRCMIEGQVRLGYGEWHFQGCSLDNAKLLVDGDVQVYLSQCHLEKPNAASAVRYIEITHPNAIVAMSDSVVVIAALTTGDPYDLCPFYVVETNTTRGLILTNINLPQTGGFRPDLGSDAIRSLTAGFGRVVADGIFMNDNSNSYVIAPGANVLYNGGATTGDTTGWTSVGNSDPAAFSADAVVKRSGTHSFKLQPAVNLNRAMRQRVPIRPGDWVLGTLWLLVSAYGTGGLVNVQIDFEAQDGTVIVTEGFTQYNRVSPSGAWELYKLGAVAPMGAVNAVFQVFTASGASAGVLVNVDDAILNVV